MPHPLYVRFNEIITCKLGRKMARFEGHPNVLVTKAKVTVMKPNCNL